MKNIILFMAILFGLSSLSYAGCGSCGGGDHSHSKKAMVDTTSISTNCEGISCDVTKGKAKKIMAKYEKELEKLNEKYTKKLNTKTNSSIKYEIVIQAAVEETIASNVTK